MISLWHDREKISLLLLSERSLDSSQKTQNIWRHFCYHAYGLNLADAKWCRNIRHFAKHISWFKCDLSSNALLPLKTKDWVAYTLTWKDLWQTLSGSQCERSLLIRSASHSLSPDVMMTRTRSAVLNGPGFNSPLHTKTFVRMFDLCKRTFCQNTAHRHSWTAPRNENQRHLEGIW